MRHEFDQHPAGAEQVVEKLMHEQVL